jgi:hypothetical protein
MAGILRDLEQYRLSGHDKAARRCHPGSPAHDRRLAARQAHRRPAARPETGQLPLKKWSAGQPRSTSAIMTSQTRKSRRWNNLRKWPNLPHKLRKPFPGTCQ